MEIVMLVVFIILVYVVLKTVADYRYNKLESEVLKNLGFSNWNIIANIDAYVAVKSRQTLEKYDDIKFLDKSFNRFLIISLDVLICRYSPLFRAFPALFISEEPHKSFYYPSCFRSQK